MSDTPEIIFPDHATIFHVGGSVREGLLGNTCDPRDWLIVNVTSGDLLELGFYGPYDSPLFHPNTHEKWIPVSLQRQFAPGQVADQVNTNPRVALVEHLLQRDLTINAMARDIEGNLIDPFKGEDDLRNKVLRIIIPSAFIENPLRVIRLARYAARFPDFQIYPDTLEAAKRVVTTKQLAAAPKEKIFGELLKVLMEEKPSRAFEVLREIGALGVLLPEVDALFGVPQRPEHHPEVDAGVHTLMALDYAAKSGFDLTVRFAVLTHDLGKAVTPEEFLPRHPGHDEAGVELVTKLCKRIGVPSTHIGPAVAVCREHIRVHSCMTMTASTLCKLVFALGGPRQPYFIETVLKACLSDARGRLGRENEPYPQFDFLKEVVDVLADVNVCEVTASIQDARETPSAVHKARISALKQFLSKKGLPHANDE